MEVLHPVVGWKWLKKVSSTTRKLQMWQKSNPDFPSPSYTYILFCRLPDGSETQLLRAIRR